MATQNFSAGNMKGPAGTTPHIDQSSGNWFLDTTDTGVHAQGDKGDKGDKGDTGKIGQNLETDLTSQVTGSKTTFTIPSNLTSDITYALYYAGQRMAESDFSIDFSAHTLTTNFTPDALEDRRLILLAGSDTSANNFTDDYKAKIDSIEEGAQKNVQPDGSEADDTQDDFIKNKSAIVTIYLESLATYDGTVVQTLKHDATGALEWVTDN
jgi:hypothetical protein